LLGHTTGFGDRITDKSTHVTQVDVAGYELGERVGHGNDRLAEVIVGHAGCTPEGACACHVAASGGCCGAEWTRHHSSVPHRCPSAAGTPPCGPGAGPW